MDQDSRLSRATSVEQKTNVTTNKSTRRPTSSSSKFNRILYNLERSIKSQFGSGNNAVGSSLTKAQITTTTPRRKCNPSAATRLTLDAAPTTNTASKRTTSNEQQAQRDTHQQQQQQQPQQAAHTAITLQTPSKSANKGCKTTLNKYQQQIVSSMRSNKLLVNNKLSIPPPHANDEARNQSHQLLFGGSSMAPTKPAKALDEADAPDAKSSCSTTSRVQLSSKSNLKRDEATSSAKIAAQLRPNSSPASSAKSLPTLATKSGSQCTNRKVNDDEDSGFSTYQSRRSLIAASLAATSQSPSISNVPTTTTTTTSTVVTTTGEQQLRQANSMILTQVPMGSMNLNSHLSTNNIAPTQHFVYNYRQQQQQQQQQHPHQHMKHPHQLAQQQFINTQQLIASNQVPILSVDSSNNCYINNSSNQLHQTASSSNNQPHRLSQTQYSDHPQLYGLYGPTNIAILPVASTIDNGQQQIYANAPPKPRRYQYYDPNHQNITPQMITSMTASSAMTTTPATNGNPQFVHNQNPFNRHGVFPQMSQQTKHQLLSNQPIYNVSYPQCQPNSLYQQQSLVNNGRLNQAPNDQRQINGAYLQQQQQQANLPHPLTKSKSSLEACDLVRFKWDRPSFDVQAHSNTLRMQSQHHLHQQQQQQQQLIYGSRLDNSNRYVPSIHQPLGGAGQFATGNLQRSKSVTHLMPDYERRNQINQQQVARDMLVNNAGATIGPKFLSVSSASTTNLNYVGLTSNSQSQLVSHHNQSAKISSQLNISHPQQQQQHQSQQYAGPVQQQSNQHQLFSAATMRQHQQRINNWPSHHQQASSQAKSNDYNSHHQLQSRLVNMKDTSSAFSNKLARQPYGDHLEEGTGKPSLDDKIKYLLIGRDNNINEAVGMLPHGTSSQQIDNAIYHQSGNNSCFAQAADWVSKQQLSKAPANFPPNGSLINPQCEGPHQQQYQQYQQQNAHLVNNSPRSSNLKSHNFSNNDTHLNDRIYINDSGLRMGNRQQGQYQVNDNGSGNNCGKQSDSSSARVQTGDNASSHLIVDLTTPRVLAKTQTTLLLPSSQANSTLSKDSWSLVNQVGLPQMTSGHCTGTVTASSKNNSSSGQPTEAVAGSVNKSAQELSPSSSSPSNSKDDKFNTNNNKVQTRTAPYYYSDLKSEEQRKALQNIVHQKSLSPPPQLLSRSTDQSSTRLALKSATMHPQQARMLSESLALRQQAIGAATSAKSINKVGSKYSSTNDFNTSASNIAKNIDKLFDSPINQQTGATLLDGNQRLNTVQSMLTLNDNTTYPINHLSANTSESNCSEYSGGDLRNKNFNKSKSLENISQKSISETRLENLMGKVNGVGGNCGSGIGLGNPVYENIKRSDKLMSAINNSTTCLSTSNRRSQSFPVPIEAKSLDDSVDSILGSSSLDESDSSLDIFDEIKISPSDNNQADISQLIEQLRNNHSKLTEEYKSTLVRIAKTIESKNKQMNTGDYRSEKLARRLQLLELKSKKCESRSKNQLALIQMMEKVLKQSKLRVSNSQQPIGGPVASSGGNGGAHSSIGSGGEKVNSQRQGSRASLSLENPISSSLESSSASRELAGMSHRRDKHSSSPRLSFDYQNVKPQSSCPVGASAASSGLRQQDTYSSGTGVPALLAIGPNAPATTAISTAITTGNNHSSSISEADATPLLEASNKHQKEQAGTGKLAGSRTKQGVIKAIVTEAKLGGEAKFVEASGKISAQQPQLPQQQQHSHPNQHQENLGKQVGAMSAPLGSPSPSVSLSTRHQQSLQNTANSRPGVAAKAAAADPFAMPQAPSPPSTSTSVLKKPPGGGGSGLVDRRIHMSIETRNNPFYVESNDEDESTRRSSSSAGSSSDSSSSPSAPSSIEALNSCDTNSDRHDAHDRRQQKESQENLLRDDEDFIEFLSTDGSSHRSQFEASQFSVSDFNTSTSTSESSASGAGNDSLTSPLLPSPSKHLFTSGKANSGGGELNLLSKVSAATGSSKKQTAQNNNGIGGDKGISNNNNNNNNNKSRSSNSETKTGGRGGSNSATNNTNNNNNNTGERRMVAHHEGGATTGEKSKFNNVLGNVIDVDICPLNNQCSPVNNQAACLN